MPSIDRLRELLGPDCDLNDQELKLLRREMQTLAELIVELASDTLTATTVTDHSPSVEGKSEVN